MLDTDRILRGLDPEQVAIAQAVGGPVAVIAGAGTGKTRALTHRVAFAVASGQADPQQIMALTFTTKAAAEMRSRLASLGVKQVQARTFHSAALRQARFFWPQVMGVPLPPVTEKMLSMVAEVASQSGVPGDTAHLRDLTGEISWAKACNVRPEGYAAAATQTGRVVSGVAPDQVAQVMAAYERVKHRAGVIDLDDILLVALGLVTEYPAVAEQVRSTYPHLLVDEYQDVSPVQHSLLKAWLGDGDDIMVVGDPAQSIHAFAGADPRFLLGFTREFPHARRFELVRNYRSSPQVVAYANALAARSQGRVQAVKLKAQCEPGPRVVVARCADGDQEVRSAISWLQQRHEEGMAWQDMAVLYRVNAQSVPFEAALAEAGVPYSVRGAERFYERAEVKAALAAWRGIAATRPDDPAVGLKDALTGLGWTPEPPEGQGRSRERWESWQALAQLVDGFPAGWTAAQAMAEIARLADEQMAPSGPGVVLATMHASKGMEFDAVSVVGVQEGLVPFSLANTDAQLAEENRLLYVAVTRAKRWLRLSWDGSRRRPSRFLDEHASKDAPRAPSAKVSRRSVRRCRVCNGALMNGVDIKLGRHAACQASYSEQLLDALKAWRLQRAKSDDAPAFVVFSDATLIAIAEAKPATPQALLAVSGVGPTKLDRYGAEVLAIVKAAD